MSGLQADILFSSMTVFYPVVSYYSSITSWTNRDISVVLIVSSFVSLFYPARPRLNTHFKRVQKIQLPASTSLMLTAIDFLNEAFCIFNVSITSSCHCKVLRCISCVVIHTAFRQLLVYSDCYTISSSHLDPFLFCISSFPAVTLYLTIMPPDCMLESCDCCIIPPTLHVHLIICFSSMGSVYMLATFFICAHKWILHNLWVGSCFNLCI